MVGNQCRVAGELLVNACACVTQARDTLPSPSWSASVPPCRVGYMRTWYRIGYGGVWLIGCRARPWPAVVVGEVWERIGRVPPTGATFGRRDGGHGGLAEKGTCIAKAGEVELSPPRHRPHGTIPHRSFNDPSHSSHVHRAAAPTMGARHQLDALKTQECLPPRPARLHGGHDQEGARTVIEDGTQAADRRGDGHAQDEEGMGGRHCPG
jgi:hypothetical protein